MPASQVLVIGQGEQKTFNKKVAEKAAFQAMEKVLQLSRVEIPHVRKGIPAM
jgi:hypothetical protein